MRSPLKIALVLLAAGLALIATGILLTVGPKVPTLYPSGPDWPALLSLLLGSLLLWAGCIGIAVVLPRGRVVLAGILTMAGSFALPWLLHAIGVTWWSNYLVVPPLAVLLAGCIQLGVAAIRLMVLATSRLVSAALHGPRRRTLLVYLRSVLIGLALGLPLYLSFTSWGYVPGDLTSTFPFSARFEWDSRHGVEAFHLYDYEIGEHVWGRPWEFLVGAQIKPQLDSYLRQTPWQKAAGIAGVNVVKVIPFALPGAWGSGGLTIDPNLTPLMRAADEGNVDAVKRLLAEGADANAKDQWGRTPLIHACDHANKGQAVIETLLQAGANVNDSDVGGDSPLRVAVITAPPESRAVIIRALLRAGAKVDGSNLAGVTPLMTAAAAGKLDVVRELLAAGADVNRQDNQGESALTVAEHRGYPLIVEALRDAGARR
ncbi:MAG: ankyrin repeat domain-containing protein [Terriglobia bacterium]|jgi:hypothetical protein